MKNWKTTMAGILAISGGLTRFAFALKSGAIDPEAITTTMTSILTGIGLIFAKDFDVTGGSVSQ